ncbi:hypothetical protein DL240_06505 [Lujinxingia litoralis]|uniref:Uncharacterized protein n=1 Tax=Lujinxingia litoralis TaxID=2211119 RepID=A0A328CCY3_9DELT|nr:hypothetical protein [Lujinxingia litoralis]RAL23801.1 hypothetical protein DL240_06505 [Lujinxingia litoralis]
MSTGDLRELLDGLPRTASEVAARARAYAHQGDLRNAEALLSAALARTSTPELRLASAEHLLARGRWAAAYHQAQHALKDNALWEAAVVAARASHHLGKPILASEHLDDALDRGADLNLISAWRDHFAGLIAEPAMPGARAPRRHAPPPAFTEEPTALADALVPEAPTELIDALAPDEPTHLVTLPEALVDADELAPHEATHLVNIPAALVDTPPPVRQSPPGFEIDDTTKRRHQPRELRPGRAASTDLPSTPLSQRPASSPTEPTLWPDVDRAQELPRHQTERQHALSTPRKTHSSGASPALPGARNASAEPELELALDALRRPHSPPRHDTSSIRRLTHLVQARLPEPLKSPARALASALASAFLVLSLVLAMAYVWRVHHVLQHHAELASSELHADTYVSHANAAQLLERARAYDPLPWPGPATFLRKLSDRLPLVGTAAPLARIEALEALTRARVAYRFEHPDPASQPGDTFPKAPLKVAAEIYRAGAWLEADVLSDRLDALVATAPYAPWVRLAHADVRAAHASPELSAALSAALPTSTPAERFAHARHLLRVDPDAGADALRSLLDDAPDHHSARVALALHLAKTEPDATLDEFLAPLASADQRQVSAADRAGLHLAHAHATSDDSARLNSLRLAAEAAPLRPDRVRPLLDHWTRQGQLLAAREQLIRTPAAEARHPYFDRALAATHLQLGDTHRAIERLKADSSLPEERLLLALAMAAEGDLDIALSETRDTPLDQSVRGLIKSLQNDAPELSEGFDTGAPSPSYRALLEAATLLLEANRAETSAAQTELRQRALQRLDHADEGLPQRILACTLALDARQAEQASAPCDALERLDAVSRPALRPLIRWHLYRNDPRGALALLSRHEALSGAHPELSLLRAEIALAQNDVPGARTGLQPALGTPTARSPRFHTLLGDIARHEGDPEQALAHYEDALERQPHHPAALLGRSLALLEQGPLPQSDEHALRSLLRHGDLGPRAWLAFAQQRRLQKRHADARENLELAMRAAHSLHSARFLHAHATEEARALAERDRRAYSAPAVDAALQRAQTHPPLSANYHIARARQALARRRPDRTRAANELENALQLAPLRCELWDEAIALRQRQRHATSVRRLKSTRPPRCR